MNRQNLTTGAASAVTCFLAIALLTGVLGAQTNVVVVLVDDLGWTDLTCQGSEYYRTPHIDRLAGQGMRFTDAYAACAVCSPTRAALLTGREPARVGVTDWIRARFQRGGAGTPDKNPTEYVAPVNRKLQCPPNPFWMEHEEVTIGEHLSAAGYATAHIGKWHLGDDAWFPQHQGFGENHGGCDYGQPPSYFDPYRNRRLQVGIPHLAPRKKGEYLTDREADEAVSFIERNRKRPFFLYYAPYAVHTPIQAKPDLVAQCEARKKTKQKNAKYAAMVHSVDDAVGRILATLDAQGLSQKTLVLFTSDNGGLLGPTDNSPLRSGKGFPYEGGVRVPFIVRWPGVVPAGKTSSAPVSSIDVLPTILEAVGVDSHQRQGKDARAIDGVSLLSHLESGGKNAVEREALFWHFPHYRGQLGPYAIIREGRYKLIKRYEGPAFELYDLEADLAESNDLAAAQPKRVATLDRKLSEHLARVGAKLPRANPDYVRPGNPVPPAGSKRPRVLLLGDSISIGYTPHVRGALRKEAFVFRPMRNERAPENCAGTTKGMAQIDRWLKIGGGRWDVIHFNFGLHDLKRVKPNGKNSNDPADRRQASPKIYEKQLRQLVAKLENTGAKLIYAHTTPVPKGVRPYRDTTDPARYNAIAAKIMKERGIPVNDLHAYATARIGKIQRRGDVHFTPAGSRALASEVVRHVRKLLPKRR